MFFWQRKDKSEELFVRKESKSKNKMILWLRERVRQCAKKNFQGCAQIYRQERRFWEIFVGFPEFFWNFLEFSTIFLEFSAIFLENFPKIFAIFFDFCDFLTIFPENFSENSRPQSVTVQPGSRHYCKFTSKFTLILILILIKILQSTKFEGSHFFNSLSTFTSINGFSQPFAHFSNLLSTTQTF